MTKLRLDQFATFCHIISISQISYTAGDTIEFTFIYFLFLSWSLLRSMILHVHTGGSWHNILGARFRRWTEHRYDMSQLVRFKAVPGHIGWQGVCWKLLLIHLIRGFGLDAARFLQMVHRTRVPSLDPTLHISTQYVFCWGPQLLTLGIRLAYPLPAGVMELHGVVFLPRCKRPSMAIYSHSMS